MTGQLTGKRILGIAMALCVMAGMLVGMPRAAKAGNSYRMGDGTNGTLLWNSLPILGNGDTLTIEPTAASDAGSVIIMVNGTDATIIGDSRAYINLGIMVVGGTGLTIRNLQLTAPAATKGIYANVPDFTLRTEGACGVTGATGNAGSVGIGAAGNLTLHNTGTLAVNAGASTGSNIQGEPGIAASSLTMQNSDTITATGGAPGAPATLGGTGMQCNGFTYDGSGSLTATGTKGAGMLTNAYTQNGGTVNLVGSDVGGVTARAGLMGDNLTAIAVAQGATLNATGYNSNGISMSSGTNHTIVNNGTINAGNSCSAGFGSSANGMTCKNLQYSGTGTLNATGGGADRSKSGVGINCTGLVIAGGTVNARGGSGSVSSASGVSTTGNITINGGALVAESSAGCYGMFQLSPAYLYLQQGTVSITNKMNLTETRDFQQPPGGAWSVTGATISGAGNIYSESLKYNIAPGQTATFTRLGPVCRIGAAEYATLDLAIGAATTGQTIKLLRDFADTDGLALTDETFTLDLNGKTMEVSNAGAEALTLENSDITVQENGGAFNLSGDTTCLIAVDSKINLTNINHTPSNPLEVAVMAGGAQIGVSGSITSTGSGMDVSRISTVTVNGDVRASKCAIYISDTNVQVNIGGDVVGSGEVIFAEGGTVVINGNVQSTGTSNQDTGIKALLENTSVYVQGNVYGQEYGVCAWDSAQVTIDGILSGGSMGYVQFNNSSIPGSLANKGIDGHKIPTTRQGYVTYTDGAGSIWVKGKTIHYDANGGSGSMTDGLAANGGNYPIANNSFAREGHQFTGWNTKADGNGTAYAVGAAIANMQADITLYAQWKADPVPTPAPTGSPAPGPVAAVSLKLNKTAVVLKIKKTVTLKPTVFPAGAENQAVAWKSSAPKTAKVDKNGKVTALKKGKAVIIAKTVNGRTAKCTIYVNGSAVSKVALDKTKANLRRGRTLALKATVTPAEASHKKIVWKSNDTNIATVTSKGVVKGVKRGRATITAISEEGGRKAVCTVTVQ